MAAKKRFEESIREFEPDEAGGELEVPVRDEEPEAEASADPDTRREKKQRRYDELLTSAKDEARQAREEAAQLRQRLDALERKDQGNETRANFDQSFQSYMGKLQKEEDDLHAQYSQLESSGRLTKETIDSFRAKARLIEEQKHEARHRYYSMKYAPQQDNTAVSVLRMEFPDMFDPKHPERFQYANAEFQKRRAKGEPDGGLPMYRKIMEEARVELGLAPRPVDASTRDRYTSRGAGSSGGAANDTVTVKATKSAMSMAQAMFPKLPPEQAFKEWAKGPGKRAALRRSGKVA